MKLKKMKQFNCSSFWLLYTALLFGLLILPSVICLRRAKAVEIVNEETDSEEIESDFTCPEQFGYYPDQSNCSRYHLCDHGKATVKSCDSGLYFSTILKTCDWPYNVQCADGNRGEFTGRHLRLRANGEEAKNENGVDPSTGDSGNLPSNRRQPVLSNEDDSYWLGRPESTLLSLGDEDDIVDSYHYEEPQRLSKPKPAQQRQQQPPEQRRNVSPSSPTTSPMTSNEEEEGENDDGRGPWFHSLNFDQIRRQEERKPTVFNRLENSTTPISTTSGPATTSSPALTNPFVAVNNGRGGGWRHTERGSHIQRQQQRPATTEVPHLLPRKALRIGNAEEDVLAGDDHPSSTESGRGGENEPDVNDLRRSQKPGADSYRLVSHNPTTSRQQQSTTVPSAELRPRHLGSSRRRNGGNRSPQQVPTTLPPPTTTFPPAATLRPWNVRQPQTSAIRNTAARTRQPSENFRNGIPENAFKQFERRPVLRDSEDAPPRENFEEDDDNDSGDAVGLDDAHYFVNPLEIRKKSSGRGRGGPTRDVDPLISGHVAKDVSNTLDGASRRTKPAANQPNTRPTTLPPTTTSTPTTRSRANKQVDPETIYRSFQAGFRGAVKPVPAGNLRPGSGASNTDDDGNTFRVNNPSIDMEYEDVGNEDEDENVEEADNTEGVAHEDINSTGKPAGGKEIVVKYDDEEEDSSSASTRNRAANSRAGSPNSQRPQFTPFSAFTTVPPPATTFRSASPTPRRLTQFVDVVLHNQPKQQTHFTPTPKSNTAIQLVDLVSKKQQKIVNPTGRSFVHFGIVPGLAPSNSSLFFPPSPLLPPTISPKQPRHVASVGDAAQSLALTPKKGQKVKVVKKIKSSKSDPKQPKRQQQLQRAGPPPPKTYQYGTYHRAKRCTPEVCQLPNCRCGGVDVPAGLEPKDIPQIVLLTFDDSVNDLNQQIYKRLFEQDRKNPNGCPIRATFYVSHEWSDYSQVQNLYSKGHEMASHSISHSFGEKFSKERWMSEIAGQREIMHLYGNVDWRDIRGMRAPFLQTGGNTMFEMLKETNFSYDSSMPVYDINPPFWPYTLDYALGHECMIEPCPTNSIPSLWEVPMIMWEDLRGGRCSMADGCYNPSDEQGVYDMVKLNFNRHYASNKAPFSMFFHSRWFLTEHNMKGFIRFFDEMLTMKDVYVLTNWQMLQWMRRPTPLSQLHRFAPFGCDDLQERPPLCKAPHTCKVRFRSETRTLRTCQQCPKRYPWTGNNGLEDDQEAPLSDQ